MLWGGLLVAGIPTLLDRHALDRWELWALTCLAIGSASSLFAFVVIVELLDRAADRRRPKLPMPVTLPTSSTSEERDDVRALEASGNAFLVAHATNPEHSVAIALDRDVSMHDFVHFEIYQL